MSILRFGGSISRALKSPCRPRTVLPITSTVLSTIPRRGFHAAPSLWGIKSQVLKDVGEGKSLLIFFSSSTSTYSLVPFLGIMEVQIIQWYVEEGAHIEEWKPLCQYQSDKAVDDVSQLIHVLSVKP